MIESLCIITVLIIPILIFFVARAKIIGDRSSEGPTSTYVNDFLVSGAIAIALSPFVIIILSEVFDDYPPTEVFIMLWMSFAITGTVIFFIISSFTEKGLAAILRRRMDGKDVEMSLPPSTPTFDIILDEKPQESHSEEKENVIEAEEVPEIEESSMEKLEKLIGMRNAGELTSEDFEEAKKEILERKPQYNKEPGDVQEEVHNDEIVEKEVKGSVFGESEIVQGSSKMQDLEKLAEMKKEGLVDDDEFKQMKKEILGK